MIIHYGYEDASGKYYVSIDAEKCDACNACIEQCPQKALKIDTVMIDIEDKQVAVVDEMQRKKLQYVCAPCHQGEEAPCSRACEKKAIATTWKKK
jgi:ferredoxin